MWRTPLGDRVLMGAEWDLFREGLSYLWDLVEMEFEEEDILNTTGVEVFDRLQSSQKLALLALIGLALRDTELPAAELNTTSEGTVAAIFSLINNEIATEIDVETEAQRDPERAANAMNWRQLTKAAFCESKKSRKRSIPSFTSRDLKQWSAIIDIMSNRILWDDGDFEMGAQFLDASPEIRDFRMRMLRIDNDYYTSIAPDPKESELSAIRETLYELTERSQWSQ